MTQKFLGMIAGIVVARIVGPEVIGMIAFGFAYASMFEIFTKIWGTPHTKLISEGQSFETCMGVFLKLRIGGTISLIFFAFSLIFIMKLFFSFEYESKTQEVVVYLSIVAVAMHQMVRLLRTTFNAKLEQVKSNLPELTRGILFQLGRIAVVLLGFKAIGLVAWDVTSSVIAFMITIWLFKDIKIGAWDKKLAGKYWSYTKPLILFTMVTLIMKFADKLVLAHVSSTKELGYYTIAFQLGGMLLLLKTNIGTIFFPLFSGYISKGQWTNIEDLIRKYQEFIILFIFPLICFLTLSSFFFIPILYGDEFTKSIIPFIILLFSSYFILFELPYSNLVTGAGKFYWYTWIGVIRVIIFLTTLYIFVAPNMLNMGAIGLAFNVLISKLLELILYLVIAKKYFKQILFKRIYYNYILIGGSAIMFYIVGNKLNFAQDLYSLFAGIVYLIFIYSILYAFSFIKHEHNQILIRMVNLRKLLKYIRKEVK